LLWHDLTAVAYAPNRRAGAASYAVYANGNAIKPAAGAFIDFLAHDFRDTPP